MKKYLTPTNILIALLILLVIRLSVWPGRDSGGGGDYTAAERAAREAVVRFAKEHEAMYRAAGRAVDRGDITTDEQLIEWLEENREEAKTRAFERFNGLMDDDLPRNRSELNSIEAAAFLEAMARGFGDIK